KEKSPYIINRSGLTVYEGATLRIEPGVVIKVVSTGRPEITVRGKIDAGGTAAEPVVFTSIIDDEYGGDTNRDGLCDTADASSTAQCPKPGSWTRMNFANGSAGNLNGTLIRYGGGVWPSPSARHASVLCEGAEVGMSGSAVEYSLGSGVTFLNCSGEIGNSMFQKNARQPILADGGSIVIHDSNFEHNGFALNMSATPHSKVLNNKFLEDAYAVEVTDTPPVFGGNAVLDGNAGMKGIRLRGASSEDYTFANDVPYIIDSQYMLGAGKHTWIEKGAIFKFMENAELTVAGTLSVSGEADAPVVFTSIHDDEFGGDTNSNGSATSPTLGSWRGITITRYGESMFDGSVVRFAGGRDQRYGVAGIKSDSGTTTIKNSVIEKNRNRGVWFNGTSPGVISDTIFRDQRDETSGYVALLFSNSASTTIQNLTFRNNGVGILSDESVSLTVLGGIDIDDTNTTKTQPPGLLP
ncbi:MAG: right-handed parallel beta-helix repeat-containing protein, partial [Candidatus Sungbacteria bacterium]|nr:right-handed parallel beta-helix repeat-containing protein [Candidatus Sungbacteria bacterium]